MRDHIDNNGIWAKTVEIIMGIVIDKDLQIPDSAFRATNASLNLSRFLHKHDHCTGENAEALHDYLKPSKLKIIGFGIDPNSCKVVTVVVSSFTGQLINCFDD